MRPLSLLIIAFALALHLPVPALAQEGILVLDTSVTTDFPTSVTFHLEAQSTSAIDRAEVRFQVQRRACVRTESSGFPELEPGTHIATEWEWDLRTGGSLPPGSVVRYRWLVRDVTGQQVETPEATHQVMDSRFQWNTLEGDMLTLYWHQGDREFARALMESAQQALDRLETFSGVRPVTPVKLFIYSSSQELQEALVFPQEWTGGVSFNGFNTVAIGINTDSLAWGQRAIAHELTHVVTDQVTFNCLGDTPTWLSEGLATYNEHASTEPQSAYANALEDGISNNTVLSVRSLSGGFPTAIEEATLAYGQSYSLVKYLRETYGADMLGDLLEAFQAGVQRTPLCRASTASINKVWTQNGGSMSAPHLVLKDWTVGRRHPWSQPSQPLNPLLWRPQPQTPQSRLRHKGVTEEGATPGCPLPWVPVAKPENNPSYH